MNVSSVCASASLLLAGWLATTPVWAAELPAQPPGPWAATGKIMASLVLILVMIAALAFLARRLQNLKWAQGGRQNDVTIRTSGVLNLGVKEKLLVVEVEGKRLLLGVTAQQITTLAEWPLDAPAHGAAEPARTVQDTAVPTAEARAAEVMAGSGPVSTAFAEVLKKTLLRV